MKRPDLSSKIDKLEELKKKNRVQFKWQDAALAIIEDLNLPNFVASSKDKEPLNVRSIIMRHAKENLPVLERRFGIVKEQHLSGAQAFIYYLGIIENENK